MSDIKVRTSTSNVSVRIGQENAVRILSSAAGGDDFALTAGTATNVVGGIASVSQLNVSGISTFNSTLNINGYLKYSSAEGFNGIAYFNSDNYLVSGPSILTNVIETSNKILTTNDGSNIPIWSNVIDGGTY